MLVLKTGLGVSVVAKKRLGSRMLLPDLQFFRTDILRLFNHEQIYLLLGSAITTIGLLAGCFSLLRRRFDCLLLWFALFASLHGIRLVINHQLLWELGLRPYIFRCILIAFNYLVPIPHSSSPSNCGNPKPESTWSNDAHPGL